MANGTIAFDTLTTSDSVNTGTEKSVNTSYIFNGVNKQWVNYSMDAASIRDSFNTTSITDNGTGDFSVTIANNMATVDYVTAVDGNYNLANGQFTAGSANGLEIYRQMTTTAYDHIAASSGNTFDFKWVLSCNLGELA
jgi:hypothetical protein|tara:strand:+ start:1188 stop:1601 length:414 start_codon:yes stop_codon:yes gene_type:complete